jgi:LAS superfamily LD-carboxypeptidase LdcB
VIDENSFIGRNESGLVNVPPENLLLRDSVTEPFARLRSAALAAGFRVRIESAYRSFERQLSIWNRKAKGELPLRDVQGVRMALPKDEEELARAILLWSALPGASRHHFGTDIDVSDASAIPAGYEVELTEQECSGMFAPFHAWLDRRIASGEAFGFNRVFVPGRGKIRPERWHISHIESARVLQNAFRPEKLRELYRNTDIACKKVILAHFAEFLDDYVYPYFL